MTLRTQLEQHRLLAIIRGRDAEASVAAARVLVEEGVRMLEVSLTGADALEVIARVSDELGGDVLLGAGTVLTERDVEASVSRGAAYVVTPAAAVSVPAAVERGVPVLAGALTPSEIVAALEAGADAVKIFPASALGPNYLKDLRAPFPDAPLVPVGGVDAERARHHLSLGATAVGVASPLVGDAADGGELGALRDRARVFLEAVRR